MTKAMKKTLTKTDIKNELRKNAIDPNTESNKLMQEFGATYMVQRAIEILNAPCDSDDTRKAIQLLVMSNAATCSSSEA
jgi:hypothetical protein